LTALCAKITKKIVGGTGREYGVFDCKGVSVVNGAQTVGSVAAAFLKHPNKAKDAKILLKLLSLEKRPEGFGKKVTIATNTQNRVDRVDFVALDPEQHRLSQELYFEGREYVYKTGDAPPKPEKGCTVTEATVALACAHHDITLAVQAKREVGKLWENIEKAPYKLIFNSSVTGTKLWRAVEVMRAVDVCLAGDQPRLSGKARLVAVHGNRFILHKVFRSVKENQLTDPDFDFTGRVVLSLWPIAREVLKRLVQEVNAKYASSYPASLFKNQTKCKELNAVVSV
jgi:AIPR protein